MYGIAVLTSRCCQRFIVYELGYFIGNYVIWRLTKNVFIMVTFYLYNHQTRWEVWVMRAAFNDMVFRLHAWVSSIVVR